MTRSLNLLFVFSIVVSSCNVNVNNSTAGNEAAIIDENAKARIDSTLSALVDAGRIAGVSALVFEGNKEAYFGAFGYSDIENKVPMDRNTIVRIYSMTKPVTGVALMQLYEQGKFQLDDPLGTHLPEFSDLMVYAGRDSDGEMLLEKPNRPVTVRDITRHTAGFASPNAEGFGELVREADVMNHENTLAQMSEKLAKLPLEFHPGEKWSYGVSVDVQARLVEKLSGQPFDQYVIEHVLGPLDMKTTGYVVGEGNMNRFAALYNRAEEGGLTRIPPENADIFNTRAWPLKPGGWGLTSTLDDYMRLARMLVNEGTLEGTTVLKPETVKLMATNHLADSVTDRMWLPSKGQVGFGIDFAVRHSPPASSDENNGVVGEFFWDGAASTLFWVDPANDLTAVLFVQIFPFDRQLHKAFRDAVYGRPEVGAGIAVSE